MRAPGGNVVEVIRDCDGKDGGGCVDGAWVSVVQVPPSAEKDSTMERMGSGSLTANGRTSEKMVQYGWLGRVWVLVDVDVYGRQGGRDLRYSEQSTGWVVCGCSLDVRPFGVSIALVVPLSGSVQCRRSTAKTEVLCGMMVGRQDGGEDPRGYRRLGSLGFRVVEGDDGRDRGV